MGNNTQSNMLAPLATPLALLVRLAIRKARSVSWWVRAGKHHASYKEGKIGLAKLVHHRCVMMETLYERRKVLPDESVLMCVRFRYQGNESFIGGSHEFVRPGDVIQATFLLGNKKGEFLVVGGLAALPQYVSLYWENTKGPGKIISSPPQ